MRERDRTGRDVAGRDGAGRDVVGRDGAAKDPAGRETAGWETAGRETAWRDGAAGDPAGGGPPGPDLADLRLRLADFASARDWGRYHTPKNLVAALSVEASELLEIFQWLTPEQSSRVMEDAAGAHRVEDEVADVLAYLLQFCEVLGIDPLAALAAKIERNETRFPVPDRTDCRHRHSSE